MEEVAINPTIDLPELTQDWEIDSWRAQIEAYVHPDPGDRSSDPTKRMTKTCPGVSRSLQQRHGQQWPAAGLGAVTVAVHPWDLLKEAAIKIY